MSLRRACVAAVLSTLSLIASAYPDKPIQVIVPYPPGGGADILTRYVVQKMAERNGWRIVVENAPGATGMIAARALLASRPDGYTVMVGNNAPNGINPGAFNDPPSPPDFFALEAAASIAVAPYVLAAPASSPFPSAPALVDALRQGAPYATYGVGSLGHLNMYRLTRGSPAVHVPYKGGAQLAQAIVTAEVAGGFVPGPAALGWIRQGKLRALAQTTPRRIEALRDVPTMAESGLAGFDAPLWWGIFLPPNAPSAVLDAWNRQMNALLDQPDVQTWMNGQGYQAAPMPREAFVAFVRGEQRKWSLVTSSIVAEGPRR